MKYYALINNNVVINTVVTQDDADVNRLFQNYDLYVEFNPNTTFVDIGYLYQNGQFVPPEQGV